MAKQLLFDEIVDEVSLDLRSHLTAEELFGLFGLRPPRVPSSPGTGDGLPDFAARRYHLGRAG